jgi:antitoxin MazE
MEATIQKWGNSLAVRLPKPVAVQAEIREGSIVDLVPTDEGLLIRARRSPRYRLSELVSRITPRNRHVETDWGKARGREEAV